MLSKTVVTVDGTNMYLLLLATPRTFSDYHSPCKEAPGISRVPRPLVAQRGANWEQLPLPAPGTDD